MEGISKKAVATSKPLRFLVGPDKREFTIHSALVAHQSPVLDALVHGRFKEAVDCSVEWDDIDERTFISFWQYVYTGEYDTPESLIATASSVSANSTDSRDQVEADEFEGPPVDEPRTGDAETAEGWPTEEPEPAAAEAWPTEAPEPEPEPEPEPKLESEPLVEDAFDDWFGVRRRKKNMAKREMLWNDFQDSWRLDSSGYVNDGTHQAEKGPKDHADIFIHHTRVYILGDHYGIARLMKLSFHKLHRALVEYVVSTNGLDNIVALLRCCYVELVPERLRQLVVHYAACKVEELWKSEEFQELLEDYGSLSRALVGSMLLRLD